VTSGPQPPDVILKANPSERIIAPGEGPSSSRFNLILAACLLIHALILAFFFLGDLSGGAEPPRAEEVPVEIVAEMPPEPEQKQKLPATQQPRPDLVTPPVVKEKPPPEKVQLDDVEMAHDAPVAGNAAKTTKGEPDKETKAPRVAPPPKLASPQPAQDKPEQEKAAAPSQDKPAPAAAPSEPQKLADDDPDAEALDKAQPQPPAKPQKQKQQPSKSPPTQGQKTTVAQQLAALAQAPSYSVGAYAKAAPISGGTEKASYESLLMGLISRQLHLPPGVRAQHLIHVGQIGLFVDELGNLTHQALYRASGDPALDGAWLAAVRHAAPFPAPPRGLPHGFILQYSNQE